MCEDDKKNSDWLFCYDDDLFGLLLLLLVIVLLLFIIVRPVKLLLLLFLLLLLLLLYRHRLFLTNTNGYKFNSLLTKSISQNMYFAACQILYFIKNFLNICFIISLISYIPIKVGNTHHIFINYYSVYCLHNYVQYFFTCFMSCSPYKITIILSNAYVLILP